MPSTIKAIIFKERNMKKLLMLLGLLGVLGGLSACATHQNFEKNVVPKHANSVQVMDHIHSFYVARKGVGDGYELIFHVMPAPEGEGFSRENYHLMVSIKKDGKMMENLKVYSVIYHPDGSKENKVLMMQMNEWYMTVYHLVPESGRYGMTVSFEEGGRSYTAGIEYPE